MNPLAKENTPPECLNRPHNPKPLKFDGKYLGPILSGEKSQTIRTTQKDIEKNSTVTAIFTDSDIRVKLFVTHRGGKFYKDLTRKDAHREGYRELSELQDDLKKFYPGMQMYTPLYYYRFKVVK